MAPQETPSGVPQDGQAIRAARYARKMSTAELGKAAGVSSRTINVAERDLRRIALKRLERIAAALDVPVTTLLREPYKSQVGALDGSGSAA